MLTSGADVLVLNHYGRDMVNSLTQAVQFGLRDKQVNGKDFAIVVPLYSRLMAQGAGENVKGILGSTNWHWSLQDEGSKAFVRSFGQKYGFPPSQPRTPATARRSSTRMPASGPAPSVRPSSARPSRASSSTDSATAPTEYRAEDHQCFKDVLVVKGKEEPTSKFDVLEVVEVTPRAQVEYPASMLGGELGPYNDGA